MIRDQATQIIELLKQKNILFGNGLTNDEVESAEYKYNIVFPPDLKLFLQTAQPVSHGFVNWRDGLKSDGVSNDIFSKLNWPLEGMLFDVKSNEFWVENWGDKPNDYEEKKLIVLQHYAAYPKLIPIYSHRYISSKPYKIGNPVYSVYQMDIIYYGYDLATYLAKEFEFLLPKNFDIPDRPLNHIDFWSNWVS